VPKSVPIFAKRQFDSRPGHKNLDNMLGFFYA